MNVDDLFERRFGGEAQRSRSLGVEILRPALDDTGNCFVGLAPDQRDGLIACDGAQRFDLFGNRR